MIAGLEAGIGEVFTSLEAWLTSSGATQSLTRLSWAVLTVLWLGHVAASTRPGREPDLIEAFGRLVLAGGLLTGVGTLTHVILTGFEALRSAGAAVLNGLIGQSWDQFVRGWLGPQMGTLFGVAGQWFTYPWAMTVLLIGLLLGVLLFAVGVMVYLAILFFAHLTLLLAVFFAPLAVALLAAPATQRWTARWAVVVVRTGLVVFCVRVIHAAVLYLAVIVPVREVASGVQQGFGPSGGNPAALGGILLRLTAFLFLMLVGTGVGVYAMLRAERLVGQFVDGVALAQGITAGPLRLGGRVAGWAASRGGDGAAPNVTPAESPPASWPGAVFAGGAGGGAQDATTIRGRRGLGG